MLISYLYKLHPCDILLIFCVCFSKLQSIYTTLYILSFIYPLCGHLFFIVILASIQFISLWSMKAYFNNFEGIFSSWKLV